MPTLKLGFLASHGGSNMQAIIDACNSGKVNAKPCVVISNNSDSQALQRAKNEGIPFYHISTTTHPDSVDDAIIEAFEKHNVDIIILASRKFIFSRTSPWHTSPYVQ